MHNTPINIDQKGQSSSDFGLRGKPTGCSALLQASIKHGVVSNFEGLQWPVGKGWNIFQILDLLHSEGLLDILHVGTLRAQKYINEQVDQSQLLRYVLQPC